MGVIAAAELLRLSQTVTTVITVKVDLQPTALEPGFYTFTVSWKHQL
ncbi:MAG TPA: hypothetical protein VFS89_06335 [Nitrosospira sp.]|nr:hypothetical protein [Nitrosospira sp.]